MATTFNSAGSIIGSQGTNNPGFATITIQATGGTAQHAITAGSWQVSVGDTFEVTNPGVTGATGYADGTLLTVTGITYGVASTAGTGTVLFNAAASGTASFDTETLTLTNETPGNFPYLGNSVTDLDAEFTLFGKHDGSILGAGSNFILHDYRNQAAAAKVSVLVKIDEINNVSGAPIANAVVNLQLIDTDGSSTEVANLATMRAGDTFYTNGLSMTYYEATTPGPITTSAIAIHNPSGSTYYPVFTYSIGV